ncbi:MAG: DUF4912 domain-containing protein [Bacillota bacterium]|jgi:hypothetical protein
MSTFLLVTGIIVAVSTLTFVYLRKQQRQKQNLKPEVTEKKVIENLEFPISYGKNQVTLLVRDPDWLFAYWEITATTQSEFSKQFGNAWSISKPTLRIYDVTNGTPKIYYDIQIQDNAESWYIHVGKPNHSFFVDLGRVLPDGRFYCIARSNIVTTPTNRVSDIIDPNWLPNEAVWNALRAQELDALSSWGLFERECE